MHKITFKISAILGVIFLPFISHAHCPLCTAGAGALAIVAASLGVPGIIIASLIGGFALALGLWVKRIIKKKYFHFQDHVVTWLIYLLTVLPLWPILKDYKALYIPSLGIDKYAETIPVNIYLVGVIVGAIILSISPYLSKKFTGLIGKQLLPFQGIVITMILLILVPLLINLLLLV